MLTRANHPALVARSDHEVAAYITLFNLALDTCGPDFVFTDQAIQKTGVALGVGSWRKPFHAPFVFHRSYSTRMCAFSNSWFVDK